MKPLPLVFYLVIITIHLCGCTFIPSLESDLDTRIDQWIKEKKYTQALDALDQVQPGHPHYALLQKKKQRILVLAKEFEKDILYRSEQLSKERRWNEAEQLFVQGLTVLPRNKILADAYHEFKLQRDHQLQLLTFQLYVDKAEWLLKTDPLRQQILQTLPEGENLDRELIPDQHDRKDIFLTLVRCGQQTLESTELNLTEQCLLNAARLNPDGKFYTTTVDIPQLLQQLKQRRVNSLSPEAKEYLAAARQALQKNDIKTAFKLFRKIPSPDHQNISVVEFKKELDLRITTSFGQGIEMGRKLYSQGDIEGALAVWNSVREFDPNNEQLTQHIERAQHVLNKLKSLKKNEPVIAPPTTKKNTGQL
ncbi:MAG: hypothetical protein HY080_00700 [Gammaproteobacteria bacterium]|nr:hypothetical protein [Gammaproteobacteria bacterium]